MHPNNIAHIKFLIVYLLGQFACFSQVSLENINLEQGSHGVGFQHYLAVDSTRTYKRIMDLSKEHILREIPISIWYPSKVQSNSGSSMVVLDYMEILKEEEEWEHLPNDFILDWFYYPNTKENQEHLKERVGARLNATSMEGTFPTIIYAPSYQASSIENFALCEFLASHGFVIISSPSRGFDSRFLNGGAEKDMETQARDIEFLIKESLNYQNVDKNAIATMGFSFGGLSNVLSQIRNGTIKANVSLDGSIRYQYETLKKSPFFDIERADIPFIHMAQKQIPDEVMKQDKIDPALNEEFKFYDDLTQSEAYSLRFNNMTHSYFSTLGILFQTRDTRQDKSDAKLIESYRWVSVYALKFLDAYLNGNADAKAFLKTKQESSGVPKGIVNIRSKKPIKKILSFEDFNELAIKNSYENLMASYEAIKKEEPRFELEEGKLNTLGLQLVFNPEKSKFGIAIFKLAVSLYPESANLFDSLAEGYLFIGNKISAIENFEKSLELNGGNQNATNRLKQLKD